MKRRQLLRGGALAAGGGLATLAGLRLSSEEASAASTALDVAGDQALVDSDGDLAAVWLDCDVEWAYELPDGVQPSTVVVVSEAGDIERTVDLSDRRLSAWLAYVDEKRGWQNLNYRESFAEIVAEALR